MDNDDSRRRLLGRWLKVKDNDDSRRRLLGQSSKVIAMRRRCNSGKPFSLFLLVREQMSRLPKSQFCNPEAVSK